jgi:hypothetical protein
MLKNKQYEYFINGKQINEYSEFENDLFKKNNFIFEIKVNNEAFAVLAEIGKNKKIKNKNMFIRVNTCKCGHKNNIYIKKFTYVQSKPEPIKEVKALKSDWSIKKILLLIVLCFVGLQLATKLTTKVILVQVKKWKKTWDEV